MSDRLKDLQRQRELARQQQEQLEREIAREMSQTAPETSSATPATPPPSAVPVVESAAEADKIIAQYNQNPRPIHDQVKSGCMIYFFAAFGLVGLGIALLYLFHKN